MPTPGHAPRLMEIFSEALELTSTEERADYLDRVCRSDPALRDRVEGLLRAHIEGDSFLESPAAAPDITAPLGGSIVADGPGSMIGPYKLMEAIGEGGMGVVYVAEQHQPVRRKVALKVIKPGMDSKQVVARFEAERQALALMDHPNIAKVLDAGATPSGRPYFVMELVRGVPITDYCDEQQLTIRERLELFVLVCRAVQHAHQKGVIHRDLKPSNILVTLHDGVPVPKVIDFGVAKATGQSLTDRTVYTGFHQLVGTPLYMSPEQVEMSGLDVDTRSDIYSLGVLLYELLTGTTPVDSETLKRAVFDEMRRIIREEEPPRPSTRLSSLGETLTAVSVRRKADPRRLGPSMKGELDWVVMKALEKDRRRRYETANDFAADVMRHLTDQPVEACPPSLWYRSRKYARRNRVALTTLTIVSLAVLGGAGVSLWQAIRAEGLRVRAENRSQLARRAVDEMYTQVAEKWLAEQSSLTALQREFLEKALAFYEQFAADEGSDPQVRHEAVRALYRVGVIRQSLGRHAEAETAFRQVVALGADLLHRYPDRPAFHLVLPEGRLKLAALCRETVSRSPGGRTGEAEQEVLQASRELATLRTAIPTDVAYRQRLAEAHELLCTEQTHLRHLPEAEAAVQAAFEMWVSLVNDYPAELEYRFGLARNYSRQGMQSMWWGPQNEEFEAALRRYEKAEAALRQADARLTNLLKDRPGDVRFRRSLSGTLQNLGVILRHQWTNRKLVPRYAEAEGVSRRSLTLLEGLAADFPDVPDYQRTLAGTLGNLAHVVSRLSEAEELLRRAVVLRESLAERHPNVIEPEANLLRTLRDLAGNLKLQGKLEEARQIHEGAVVRARAYLKAHPEQRSVHIWYTHELVLGVAIATELGDHPAAVQAAEEFSRTLVSACQSPDLGEAVGGLMEVSFRDASADAPPSEQREWDARTDFLLAKALGQEVLRRGSDDCRALYLLADWMTAGTEEHRDPELALRCARRALELKPGDGMYLQSLGWALYRTGDWKGCIEALGKTEAPRNGSFLGAIAHWKLGDHAQARTCFERADTWLKGYEKRCEERLKQGTATYPPPAMLRRFRAEAAALMGTDVPEPGERPQAERNLGTEPN